MKLRYSVFSLAIAAGLFAIPATADAQQSARPQVGQPVEQAGQLFKQKKYKEALAKLAAADAVADKTAYERHIIEGMRASVEMASGDTAGAVKAMQADIATGQLPAQDVAARLQTIVELDYQQKNYPQTIADTNAYYQHGGTADEPRLLTAQAYFLQSDYANAAKTLRVIIASDQKAGKKPDEQVLLTLLNCEFQLKDNAGRVDVLKQLVALYPKKEYWSDLETAVAQKPGFASRLALDLDRLKLVTGTLAQANEYMDAAQLALLANLPGDAKTILDKGYAASVLGTGADADRQKRLATMAGGEASTGSAGLAKQASDAAAAPKGDALEKLGEAYASFGQYPQAIAAYQQALQKGGLQYPDDAKLHLGTAQLAAGQKPQARQTLAGVTGADGTADLAQLWLLQAGV